jgi:hypothetical protein
MTYYCGSFGFCVARDTPRIRSRRYFKSENPA